MSSRIRIVLLLAAAVLLSSCAVDKTALAKQVDLRDVDLRSVPDGVYEGSYEIHPPFPVMAANRNVRVRVTVTGGRYADIELIQPPSLAASASMKSFLSRVRERQSLSPDAITSGTVSSMAVLKAIQETVGMAGKTSQ